MILAEQNAVAQILPLTFVTSRILCFRYSGTRLREDVRILVETAILAGAVIGSGKRFSLRRVTIEENIPDRASNASLKGSLTRRAPPSNKFNSPTLPEVHASRASVDRAGILLRAE